MKYQQVMIGAGKMPRKDMSEETNNMCVLSDNTWYL